MVSPSSRTDGAVRRHDLVVVSQAAWRALLAERRDLAGEVAEGSALRLDILGHDGECAGAAAGSHLDGKVIVQTVETGLIVRQ